MKLSIGLTEVSDVCILSDSQAALRAQDSPHITSRSVLTCHISIEDIATQMNICQVTGTFQADEFARQGNTTELQTLHNDYGILIIYNNFGTNTQNRPRPRTYSKL